MLNPLVSGLAPVATSLPLAIERPQIQPDPAVKVTASGNAELGGNAAQSGQSNPSAAGAAENSLEEALNKVNESMQAWSTGIRFEVDDDTERMVVKLVNNETGDVIRQVPSEAMLRVTKMITQLQGGGIDTQA